MNASISIDNSQLTVTFNASITADRNEISLFKMKFSYSCFESGHYY